MDGLEKAGECMIVRLETHNYNIRGAIKIERFFRAADPVRTPLKPR